MNGIGGNNIKIHFAGAEQISFAMIAHEAGVQYFLFTCFPFISQQVGIRGYPNTTRNIFPPDELRRIGKHVIMDSGLFTLMFGAHAGRQDQDFVYKWQDLLIQFVLDNKITATCVEVDCQKVLGPEHAWILRERLREALPNNRIINVFHLEDGKEGLDRLIEYSDYIAISVPELRLHNRKTYKQDAIGLAKYVKTRKPRIDIHMLGCTEFEILPSLKFCTSADSTSWQASNRFGRILTYKTSQLRQEAREEAIPAAKRVLERIELEPTPKRIEYYSNYYLSAKISKTRYTELAGNQN